MKNITNEKMSDLAGGLILDQMTLCGIAWAIIIKGSGQAQVNAFNAWEDLHCLELFIGG